MKRDLALQLSLCVKVHEALSRGVLLLRVCDNTRTV